MELKLKRREGTEIGTIGTNVAGDAITPRIGEGVTFTFKSPGLRILFGAGAEVATINASVIDVQHHFAIDSRRVFRDNISVTVQCHLQQGEDLLVWALAGEAAPWIQAKLEGAISEREAGNITEVNGPAEETVQEECDE